MFDRTLLAHYSWAQKVEKILSQKTFRREWSVPGSSLLPKYYTCSYLTYNDRTTFGLFIHGHPLASKLVSVLEAYERLVMFDRGIKNSNGCAIHSTQLRANEAARNEFLERYAYLRFHYLKTGFYEVFPPSDSNESKFVQALSGLGISLRFGIIGENSFGKACIAIADGKDYEHEFGLLIGLGFENSIEKSLVKSFNEIVRFIDTRFEKPIKLKPMSFEQFHLQDRPGVNEHISLGLDLEYSNFLRDSYYLQVDEVPKLEDQINFEYYEDKATLESVPEPDLYFSRAYAENILGIQFGKKQNYIEEFFAGFELLKYNNQVATHILG